MNTSKIGQNIRGMKINLGYPAGTYFGRKNKGALRSTRKLLAVNFASCSLMDVRRPVCCSLVAVCCSLMDARRAVCCFLMDLRRTVCCAKMLVSQN